MGVAGAWVLEISTGKELEWCGSGAGPRLGSGQTDDLEMWWWIGGGLEVEVEVEVEVDW